MYVSNHNEITDINKLIGRWKCMYHEKIEAYGPLINLFLALPNTDRLQQVEYYVSGCT